MKNIIVELKNNEDEKSIVLKEKIISSLKSQGFKVNPHLRPAQDSKDSNRLLQQNARLEQLKVHREFLFSNEIKIRKYSRSGIEIDPEKITLELREVKSHTLEADIFTWWNLAWWSIPYQHPYGRQMRFILWDTYHEAPFGLIALQSPILKMSVRDKTLKIPKEELDLWINKSMNAQRVGALPPYNELLGGKLVALSMTANEIREAYRRKYSSYTTEIKKRIIEPDLLFITTTSAFGRSSLYNRLSYRGEEVAVPLGYTQGSGTFHIPDLIYMEMLELLNELGVDTARHFGHGPSKKLKLISLAFNYLGLHNFTYHGIKREFYLFPLVKNLDGVIHSGEEPLWINHPFSDLTEFWKVRWGLPRSERMQRWKEFKKDDFFENVLFCLKEG